MRRREVNVLLDWVVLATGLLTFATGLVLLLHFHVGRGALAASALGVDKLVWLNVHRLCAALLIAGVAAHVTLHWRAFCGRLRIPRLVNSESILYAAFAASALTGLVAWFVLDGSSPLLGPAVIGLASHGRHAWIDTHHVSSLVSLLLVVHHVGHRWRFMRVQAARR